MDTKLQDFYNGIVFCLMRYAKLAEEQARHLIDESSLFRHVETDVEKSTLFHESPYFWAMHLVHSKQNPEWYQDPTLWPPPEDYIVYMKSRGNKST